MTCLLRIVLHALSMLQRYALLLPWSCTYAIVYLLYYLREVNILTTTHIKYYACRILISWMPLMRFYLIQAVMYVFYFCNMFVYMFADFFNKCLLKFWRTHVHMQLVFILQLNGACGWQYSTVYRTLFGPNYKSFWLFQFIHFVMYLDILFI